MRNGNLIIISFFWRKLNQPYLVHHNTHHFSFIVSKPNPLPPININEENNKWNNGTVNTVHGHTHATRHTPHQIDTQFTMRKIFRLLFRQLSAKQKLEYAPSNRGTQIYDPNKRSSSSTLPVATRIRFVRKTVGKIINLKLLKWTLRCSAEYGGLTRKKNIHCEPRCGVSRISNRWSCGVTILVSYTPCARCSRAISKYLCG